MLKSFLLILLATRTFSEPQITGGLLTCTPETADKKPDVYMFNSEYLVKQGDRKDVYKFVGDYRHYKLFVGTVPSEELKLDVHEYNETMKFLEKYPDKSIKYLKFFHESCATNYGSKHPDHIDYDQTKFKNQFYTFKDVPDFWGVGCHNIDKVREKSELPKPKLNKENHIISKMTVDTRDWSIVLENSQLCEECEKEGRSAWSWDNGKRRFWSSETSCVVVKLDKVEIDVTEDLFDPDKV